MAPRASHLTLVTAPDDRRNAAWLAALAPDYADADVELLKRVLEWSGPRLANSAAKANEPALDHALNVAAILRELKLDAESLAASLLVPLATGHDALVEIRDRFGPSIAALADGVARM